MKVTETQEMKARIDSVIESASKYGRQAELLSSTRNSLTEYIDQAKKANKELLSAASMTRKVMEDTDQLVNGKMFDAIQPEVDRVLGLIAQCKAYLTETTAQYDEAIRKLEDSKAFFSDQNQKAEELLTNTTGEVRKSIEQLKSDIETSKAHFSAIANRVTDTNAVTISTVSTKTEELSKLITAIQTDTADQLMLLNDRINELHQIQKELQERVLSFESAVNQNGTSMLENVCSVQAECREVKAEVSALSFSMDTIRTETDAKIENLASQIASSAKQQKLITIGCTVLIAAAMIVLFVIK